MALELHFTYNLLDRFAGEDRNYGIRFPNQDGSTWRMVFKFYDRETGEIVLTLDTDDSSIVYTALTHEFTLKFTASNTAGLPEYTEYIGYTIISGEKKVFCEGLARFKPLKET